jgi:hypothetical protein
LQEWVPVIVAVIAAAAALTGYFLNSAISRREQKARYFAEALSAVERYRQLPYTIRRRHDSTSKTRAELAELIGEEQVNLTFYRRWLALDSPAVVGAYDGLISKIREKNSIYRQEASSAAPIQDDSELGQKIFYEFNDSAEREACLELMRRELKLFRWPQRP